MGIWSRIKSAAKRVVSTVKRTVTKVVKRFKKPKAPPPPPKKQKKIIKVFKTKAPKPPKKEKKKKSSKIRKVVSRVKDVVKSVAGKVKAGFKEADVKMGEQLETGTGRLKMGLMVGGIGLGSAKIVKYAGDKIAAAAMGGAGKIAAQTASGANFAKSFPVEASSWAKGITKPVQDVLRKMVGGKIVKTKQMVQATLTKAPAFAINTRVAGQTAGLITKILKGAGKFVSNPIVVGGAILTAIGSYPFAGFIKEESLQTLSYALSSAIKNNDVEGMQAALAELEEVLHPDIWDKIKGSIPYLNILANLDDFYEAAKVKLAIDRKVVEDMITQQDSGESDAQKWQRIREEQAAGDRAVIDYYTQERMKLLRWEEEAADRDMKEDARFWAKEAAKQRKLEEEDRKAIAEFWIAYRKRVQEIAADNRPSNLNFGLL